MGDPKEKRFAYSTMTLKAISDDGQKRVFTGIASTPTVDRMEDIVMPKGAVYVLPLPLLWQHCAQEPIGWVRAVRISDSQIEVDCEVHNEQAPGKLKDRLDEAWQSIKAQLVRGLSIGFNAIETSRIEGSYGIKYLKWAWHELSPVTIPAQMQASITAIKAADVTTRTALGFQRTGVVRLDQKFFLPPSSKTNTTDPRAALGLSRKKGVVRLADPPGASGNTKAKPA